MPKTKFQKQQEALARKRAAIDYHREQWQKTQAGSAIYKQIMQQHGGNEKGRNEAESNAAYYAIRLKKACAEAQVDTHGNPLKD